jgi:glutathione reductase (NADPH)
MKAKGVVTSEVHIDWPGLMAFKRTFTDPVPQEREKQYKDAGIIPFHGKASFVGQSSLAVGNELLEAQHFVLAAGARPASLGIDGESHLLTSEQFLELEQLPERLIFVGGGYISFEFAHVAARAGAHPRILHRGSRPLPGFDPDLVSRLVDASRAVGIDIHLNTKVGGIERDGDRLVVRAEESEREVAFEADAAIHGAGRVADIDDLELQKASIASSRSGVSVNEFLQSTTNPAVYAAGDAAAGGGLPLTPVAVLEGEIVAQNLIKGNHRTANFAGLASIVYTIPPLASVGLTETEAVARGIKYRVHEGDAAQWYSTRRLAADYAWYKVLVEESTGLILGAHLLSPYAEELANVLDLAIRTGLKAPEVNSTLFAYPTGSSDLAYMM